MAAFFAESREVGKYHQRARWMTANPGSGRLRLCCLRGLLKFSSAEVCGSNSGGGDWIFNLAVFDLFPAVDAIRGPGESFQALQTNGLAAVEAFSVRTLIQPF